MRRPFSRPCGTHVVRCFSRVETRAIFRLSRWDKAKASKSERARTQQVVEI